MASASNTPLPKILGNIINAAGGDVVKAANAVGSYIGNQSIGNIPLVGTDAPLPTFKQVAQMVGPTSPASDILNGQVQQIPSHATQAIEQTASDFGDNPSGKVSPMAVTGSMETDAADPLNPEEKANPNINTPQATVGKSQQALSKNPFKKVAMAVNQVNTLQSEKLMGPDEQYAQQVINDEVPGNSLKDKANNYDATINKLHKTAKAQIASSPVAIPWDEMKTTLMKKMQPLINDMEFDKDGTLESNTAQAEKQVDAYMQRFYREVTEEPIENKGTPNGFTTDEGGSTTARGSSVNPTKYVRMGGVKPGVQGPPGYLKEISNSDAINSSMPNISKKSAQEKYPAGSQFSKQPYTPVPNPQLHPDSVDSPVVFDVKTAGNKAARRLYGKEWSTLNPIQKTTLQLNNGLNDLITKYHPNVADTTWKEHLLLEMRSALANGRNIGSGINIPLPGHNFASIPIPLSGTTRKTLSSILNGRPSKTAIGAGLLLGGGTIAAGSAYLKPQGLGNGSQNNNYSNPNNNFHIEQSISQKNTGVKLGNDGLYHLSNIPSTTTNSQFMTPQQYLSKIQGLNTSSAAYEQITNQYNVAQKLAQNLMTSSKIDFMTQADNYFTTNQQVEKEMGGFLNPLNASQAYKNLNAWLSTQGNQNAKIYNDIQTVNTNAAAAYEAINGQPMTAAQQKTAFIQPSDSPEEATEKLISLQNMIVTGQQYYLPAYLITTGGLGLSNSSSIDNQGGSSGNNPSTANANSPMPAIPAMIQ